VTFCDFYPFPAIFVDFLKLSKAFLGQHLLGKSLSGQLSFWANVVWTNVTIGYCLMGKCRMGKCRMGKRHRTAANPILNNSISILCNSALHRALRPAFPAPSRKIGNFSNLGVASLRARRRYFFAQERKKCPRHAHGAGFLRPFERPFRQKGRGGGPFFSAKKTLSPPNF
jgi:hypothetical protein